MAGLVPAIPLRQARPVRQFYLYILASRPGGAIYIGVTSNLVRRVYEHRNGFVEGHTSASTSTSSFISRCSRPRETPFQREKNMKHWPRAWKARLIAESNPTWRDLYDEIAV